jgi:hypothetical protein
MANTSLKTGALVTQLRALEHLTRIEAALARTRTAQARTDAVRAALQRNATDADRRSAEIAAALRDLDAVPDVVAPALGWATTLLRSAVEQARPVDEALLDDLALEHRLADRARYLLALTHGGPASVHRLAQRLLDSHLETVDWLQTVIGEEAVDGLTALRPTPLQAVATGVSRVAGLPARATVAAVNRAAHALNRMGRTAERQAGLAATSVERLATGTREVVGTGLEAGFDAAAGRAEELSRENGGDGRAVHAVRRETGSLTAAELPIAKYEDLSVKDATAAVQKLREAHEVTAVARFEERHRNRAGVLSATRERLATLAREASALS